MQGTKTTKDKVRDMSRGRRKGKSQKVSNKSPVKVINSSVHNTVCGDNNKKSMYYVDHPNSKETHDEVKSESKMSITTSTSKGSIYNGGMVKSNNSIGLC